MRKRKHNRTAGFSLIEVVVGIAVMGLVTAPVCASLLLSVRLNSHSQALMEARLQASGVVETLLAEGIPEGTENIVPTEEGLTVSLTDKGNYFDVIVTSTVGDEEVSFKTCVRAVEPPAVTPSPGQEGGDT